MSTDKPKAPDGNKAAWLTAGIVIAVSILSTFTLSTPTAQRGIGDGGADDILASEGSIEEGEGADIDGGSGAGGSRGGSGGSGGGRTTKYDCSKRQNAGATDVGIAPKEVRMAATVVKTGDAADFLSDAQFGMEAVLTRYRSAGGICGRLINVEYRDDGWVTADGQRIIEGFIGDKKYFGLAVNPSSEGLRGAINSEAIRKNKFPAVGADGMLIGQYTDPWVWPVATSTSSVMHIMAQNALDRGARKFGIVWENNYRFGKEGHEAFVGTVRRGGGEIKSDAEISGGLTDYSNSVDTFIKGCGGVSSLADCEFIAMLLEPVTASQWVRNGGLGNGDVRPKIGTSSQGTIGAPQPLFLDSFARDCGRYCANMWVWTSFRPPIPPFDTEPAVARYRADLRAVSDTADANNPHVQGAYVGMLLLTKALEQLGPAPTRDQLQKVLDSMVLETGLAPPIKFTPGNHFGAISAQAFEAIVISNSFSNWRYTNSGFIVDKDVGKDIPAE